jgi:rhodanese-related sulfurtransferase
MKNFLFLLFILSTTNHALAQLKITDVLKKYNTGSIPYIYTDAISLEDENIVVLDAREKTEYEVSHIKDAVYIGYKDFNERQIQGLLEDKSQKIIVYCSLGVRSEDIAEHLKNKGYTRVYNLYGGIFEWVNHGLPVYNNEGKRTDSIHAYSENWSRFLKKGIKVYD